MGTAFGRFAGAPRRGGHGKPGLPRFLFAPLVLGALVVFSPRASAAGERFTGVEGVTALGGELVAGVVVHAFARPGPGPAERPLASSAPSDREGRYRLALPPGPHHLVAARTRSGGWGPLAPGDLFSYHLGNPVTVEHGRASRVAFSLVAVPADPPASPAAGAGVSGVVTFGGAPLPRAYVYVYRDPANAFRGLGDSVVPAGGDGTFRLRLAPGRYWIIARKRRQGGMYGPPGRDDYVGYYPGNPVEVRAGEGRAVTVETTTRVDDLERALGAEAGKGWTEGRVVDAAGNGIPGLYVLLYRPGQELTGVPAKVAGPTGAAGAFRVASDGARYRVVARANLGGPPEEGEWHGAWRGTRGEDELPLTAGRTITIRVAPHRPAP